MADFVNRLIIDTSAFNAGLKKAAKTASALDDETKVKLDVDTSDIARASKQIDGLSRTETVKIAVSDSDVKKSAGAAGNAFAGAIGGAATGAVLALGPKLFEAAKAADALGDNLQLAFSQAGLSLEEQNKQLSEADGWARSLSDQYAISARESKALLAQVVGLTGQTGAAAQNSTKFALGIEKASGGLIKAEVAAKILAKGVDPENAEAVEALAKRFPQLAGVLKSTAPLSEKVNQGLNQLGGTFTDLERQAKGPTGSLDRLQQTFDQLFQDLANPLFQALAPTFDAIGKALTPLLQSITPIVTEISGSLGAVVKEIANSVLPALQSAFAPILDLVKLLLPPVVALIQSALKPLAAAVTIVAKAFGDVLSPIITALQPVFATITGLFEKLAPVFVKIVEVALTPFAALAKTLGPILGKLISNALTPLVAIIDQLTPVFIELIVPLTDIAKVFTELLGVAVTSVVKIFGSLLGATDDNADAMATFRVVLDKVAGVIKVVADIVRFAADALGVFKIAVEVVVESIGNLLEAVRNFDLDKIKSALLGFGNVGDEIQKRVKGAKESIVDVGEAAADAVDPVNNIGGALNKTGGAAGKATDEIAKLRAELEALQTQGKKQLEIASAASIDDAEARARKLAEISFRFDKSALDEQLAAIKGNGQKELLQRQIIQEKIKQRTIQYEGELTSISGAGQAERLTQLVAAEQAQRDALQASADVTIGLLQRQFQAGNIAPDLVRQAIDTQTESIQAATDAQVRAIVESTPEYAKAAEEIQRQLSEGIIPDAETAKKRTDELRASILAALSAQTGGTNPLADQIATIIKQGEIQAADAAKGIRESVRDIGVSLIASDILRGIEEQVVALEKQRDVLLQNEALTKSQREEIEQGFAQAIDKVRGKLSGLGDVLRTISESARSITVNLNADQATEDAADLKAQIDEINAALLEGAITYQDALSQIGALQKEQAGFLETFASSFSDNLGVFAEGQRALVTKTLGDINAIAEEIDKVSRDTTKTQEQRAEEVARLQELQSAKQSQAINAVTAEGVFAFGQLLVAGENVGDALKKVAGSVASSLVDLYTPTILALFQSIIPPPFGAIAGGIAVAGIKAVLSSALAGFEEGGYTGNVGTKQIAGVVHGQEYVVNAKTLRNNPDLMPMLDFMQAGGKSADWMERHGEQVSTGMVMASTLMRIEKQLARIPDESVMKHAYDVNLALDDRLYERQRKRAKIRGLR